MLAVWKISFIQLVRVTCPHGFNAASWPGAGVTPSFAAAILYTLAYCSAFRAVGRLWAFCQPLYRSTFNRGGPILPLFVVITITPDEACAPSIAAAAASFNISTVSMSFGLIGPP